MTYFERYPVVRLDATTGINSTKKSVGPSLHLDQSTIALGKHSR